MLSSAALYSSKSCVEKVIPVEEKSAREVFCEAEEKVKENLKIDTSTTTNKLSVTCIVLFVRNV